MKILTIVGARPQFVKAAVVSRAIGNRFVEEIIHTGQHYDARMSDVFFEQMGIPKPVSNLNTGSGTHAQTTAAMLVGIEGEILSRKPDLVMVYGDTNSTIAGALAAAKLEVPVAHVEAGQRSFNRAMPEEMNRVLTDHISSLLFCSAKSCVDLLKNEGITKNVFYVGDVMYDAFLEFAPQAKWPADVSKPQTSYVLATVHRAQNTDDPRRLKAILDAFASVSHPIVFPIHPRTKKMVENNGFVFSKNIQLVEPQAYFEMLALLRDCAFVITDSGGLQKEAYYAGKRCLVLREETEWTELVEIGAAKLVGANNQQIVRESQWAQQSSHLERNIYGDGKSAEKIVTGIFNYLSRS